MNHITTKCLPADKLRDGREFVIRAVGAGDRDTLSEVMHHLSPQSRYFRYLTIKGEPSIRDLEEFTNINLKHHWALVAKLRKNGKELPIGIGEYFIEDSAKWPTTAEVAFVVEEEFQGLGIATALLTHLANIARANGIEEFTALVHPDNQKMLDVFLHSGFPVHFEHVIGAIQVRLKLTEANGALLPFKTPA